jgi:hypothetical protein
MARCHGFNPTDEEEFWTQCTKKAKHQLAGEEFCDEHYWKTNGALLAFLDDGYIVLGLVLRKTGSCTKHGLARDGVRGAGIRKFFYDPVGAHGGGILQGDGGSFGE